MTASTAALERRLVGLRRLREAADLADVLERGGVDLLLGRRRLEVVEGADVSTHDTPAVGDPERTKGAVDNGALREHLAAQIPR